LKRNVATPGKHCYLSDLREINGEFLLFDDGKVIPIRLDKASLACFETVTPSRLRAQLEYVIYDFMWARQV
jgi:hypothetical protein